MKLAPGKPYSNPDQYAALQTWQSRGMLLEPETEIQQPEAVVVQHKQNSRLLPIVGQQQLKLFC